MSGHQLQGAAAEPFNVAWGSTSTCRAEVNQRLVRSSNSYKRGRTTPHWQSHADNLPFTVFRLSISCDNYRPVIQTKGHFGVHRDSVLGRTQSLLCQLFTRALSLLTHSLFPHHTIMCTGVCPKQRTTSSCTVHYTECTEALLLTFHLAAVMSTEVLILADSNLFLHHKECTGALPLVTQSHFLLISST